MAILISWRILNPTNPMRQFSARTTSPSMGSGSLTVNANYFNGIQSKDDLKITGGNIVVNAVNDGIKGRDSISIKNANISVKAGGDGIQSTNDTNPEKGYIAIYSGTLSIAAAKDGIRR